MPYPSDNSNFSQVGTEAARYLDIPVFENGSHKDRSHGKHFSLDQTYYYGQKWQCVEFVKRFYDQALNHRMPHVWGHARDFFDASLSSGKLNQKRNLLQFRNDTSMAPKINDILVFSDSRYGHLAIVTAVYHDAVLVIQQNIAGMPLQNFHLRQKNGRFLIDRPRIPDGWLRLAVSQADN